MATTLLSCRCFFAGREHMIAADCPEHGDDALPHRCPECGAPVANYFDHVDGPCPPRDEALPAVDMTVRSFVCDPCSDFWQTGSDWPITAAERGNPAERPEDCPNCDKAGRELAPGDEA